MSRTGITNGSFIYLYIYKVLFHYYYRFFPVHHPWSCVVMETSVCVVNHAKPLRVAVEDHRIDWLEGERALKPPHPGMIHGFSLELTLKKPTWMKSARSSTED